MAKDLGISCSFTLTEKDPDNPRGKKQVWTRSIPAGANVLQVEDLSTTLKTPLEVRQAIWEGNQRSVNFLPYMAMIIHRPEKLPISYGEIKIISLIEKAVQAWDPKKEYCPYCGVGSVPIEPRDIGNWARLTGKT